MKTIDKYELFIVVIILCIAGILRLYALGTYPSGLHNDEAWTGIEARRILESGWIGIWSPGAHGQPTLPFYWTALTFKFFGVNIYTLRMSFALLSILSLPFFYLTVKLLFKKRVAIISLILLSSSFILLEFSRIAPTHSLFLVPFFPATYFFLKSIKQNSPLSSILSGIFVGIAPYCYAGLRILPILFVLFIVIKAFQKDFVKKHWKNLLLLLMTATIIVLPLLIFSMQNKYEFLYRTNKVSIFSENGLRHYNASVDKQFYSVSPVIHNTISVIMMFFVKGDNDHHNLPIFSMFTWILFLAGLIVTIIKYRNENTVFLYLWFLLFLSGSILTVDAPNFRRTQPSIAATYVFTSLGIIFLYDLISTKLLQKGKNLSKVLLLMCVFLISIYNIYLYVNYRTNSSKIKHIFSYNLVKISKQLNSLPKPLYVYFYGNNTSFHHETLRFLSPNITGEDRSREFGYYSLKNNHSDINTAYIFLPSYHQSFQDIQNLYPEGKARVYYDNNLETHYSYFVPKKTK